ncbi:hypothetical protein EVAR_79691_1 [Eumeta japonica]|uniref:Uncharacterized protein n=1 Tax=Eumeta variegata TaxID=151549 RepID=A0A4C1TBP5_EUMVA|nr:hypothetical protein EVAR_79691_1 [Eumeta japonica]
MPEWKGRVPLTRSHCERITYGEVHAARGPGFASFGNAHNLREYRQPPVESQADAKSSIQLTRRTPAGTDRLLTDTDQLPMLFDML